MALGQLREAEDDLDSDRDSPVTPDEVLQAIPVPFLATRCCSQAGRTWITCAWDGS